MTAILAKDGAGQARSVFAFCCGNGTPGTASTGAPRVVTAAGAGDDATKHIGETINRMLFGMPMSGLLSVGMYGNFTDTKTLALAMEYQLSSDGTTWDTAVVIEASDVKITNAGGGISFGAVDYAIALASKKQYIRFNCTPDLSATGTDTAIILGNLVMFGAWDNKLLVSAEASA